MSTNNIYFFCGKKKKRKTLSEYPLLSGAMRTVAEDRLQHLFYKGK